MRALLTVTGGRLALAGFWLLGLGNGLNAGNYSALSLALVCGGCALLTTLALKPDRFPLTVPSPRDLAVTVLLTALLFPLSNINLVNDVDGVVQARAMIFLAALVASGMLLTTAMRPVGGGLLVVVAAAAGALTIHADPRPDIDVWHLVDGAANSIVRGSNMYTDTWPASPDITDAFPYLPMTGLLLAPFRLVALDVRVGLLLACLSSAVLLWRACPARLGPGIAALSVTVPGWVLLVDLSWTEPLLLVGIVVAVLAVRGGHPGYALVALALALATKQHVLLLIPVFAAWPAFGWRRAVTATGLASAVTLPWFLASPRDFLDDALLLNLNLPPRPDSLSLFSLALDLGLRPPFALVGVLSTAALVVAARLAHRLASASGTLLACAWVLSVFSLLNKQSFFNEWWLVIELLLAALALAPSRRPAAVALDEPRGRAAVA